MPRIDQLRMKTGFLQFKIDRFPVNAGAFHDDCIRTAFENPLDEFLAFFEISSNRQELVVDLFFLTLLGSTVRADLDWIFISQNLGPVGCITNRLLIS